jgi:bacteriorhodopsin
LRRETSQGKKERTVQPDLFTISVEGFEIVSHILTLGYASMAAAMLFFVLTKNNSLPKFQMSSVISVVVMVSALLLLYTQKMSWVNAYAFNGEAYVLNKGADLFTNGYRYLNWLIDVPMLLIQILFVAGIAGAARASYMTRFTISGVLMIITGYIGQFYEPGRLNESVTQWAFWGLVSTAFFIYVLVLITRVINDGKSRMEGSPQRIFGAILPLFYVAWWLYPIAYVAPILMQAGVSYELTIVSQQVIYTIADIASKVIYGIMLTATAILLSEQEGYKNA